MRLLLVVPSTLGHGELSIALDFVERLERVRFEVEIVASASLRPLLVGSRFACYWLLPGVESLNRILVADVVATLRPDAVLVVDFLTYDLNRGLFGLDDDLLTDNGTVPLVPFDLYGLDRTSLAVDTMTSSHSVSESIKTSVAISPCPLNYPKDGTRSTFHYAFGAGSPPLAPKQRRHLREAMGVSAHAGLVLMTSSPWQHHLMRQHGGVAAIEILRRTLRTLDKQAVLVHVGPESFDPMGDDAQYQWFPSMDRLRFDQLLLACDLYLCTNPIATTLCRAILSGVPALVIQNSIEVQTNDHLLRLAAKDSLGVLGTGLEGCLPIRPFRLWPAGWFGFLGQVFADNPMREAFEVSEVLEPTHSQESMRSLIFDSPRRQALIDRQFSYKRLVASLPDPSQVMENVANL